MKLRLDVLSLSLLLTLSAACGGGSAESTPDEPIVEQPQVDPTEADAKALRGEWKLVTAEGGQTYEVTATFDERLITMVMEGMDNNPTLLYKIDASQSPRVLDFMQVDDEETPIKGVYQISADGKRVDACFPSRPTGDRPTAPTPCDGEDLVKMTFTR